MRLRFFCFLGAETFGRVQKIIAKILNIRCSKKLYRIWYTAILDDPYARYRYLCLNVLGIVSGSPISQAKLSFCQKTRSRMLRQGDCQPMPKANQNAIGERLRKFRTKMHLSQAGFAALCQINGWNITRETIARIEGGSRCVTDFELLLIAENLRVPVAELLPADGAWKKGRKDFLSRYFRGPVASKE